MAKTKAFAAPTCVPGVLIREFEEFLKYEHKLEHFQLYRSDKSDNLNIYFSDGPEAMYYKIGNLDIVFFRTIENLASYYIREEIDKEIIEGIKSFARNNTNE